MKLYDIPFMRLRMLVSNMNYILYINVYLNTVVKFYQLFSASFIHSFNCLEIAKTTDICNDSG